MALDRLTLAWMRRKRFEARLLAIELAPLLGASTSGAASFGGGPVGLDAFAATAGIQIG